MRTGPSGEERGTPHYTVPVSPQCPQEISLHDLSPPLGVVETMGVAPEGAQLIASGLSTEVAETILQSRAPSIRKLYALKLRLRVRRPPA